MKKNLFYIISLILTLLCHTTMYAKEYTVTDVPNAQVAHRAHFVSDPDNFLGETATAEINQMLYLLRDSNTVEVAVVVLPSIGNEDIDLFATELFTHWGIGQKENSNGLLILAVMNQRQIVFRTGYGIEGVLPDAICKRIINRYIVPAFREGEYGEGMRAAVQQVVALVTTPDASAELMAEKEDDFDPRVLLYLLYGYLGFSIVLSLVLSIVLYRIVKRHRNAPYEGYKKLNNLLLGLQILAIFFPLWNALNLSRCRKRMTEFREKPRECDACHSPMHKLNETDDNAYLTPQEDTEERIGSVDYDVWVCDKCDNIEVLRFEAQHTKYSECPHCHSKAYSLSHDHIVRPATSLAAGKGEKVYTCSHCHLRKALPYIIPMIVVGSSRGGSSGGGSFGGGFGGGFTGGGGARGGW